MIREVMKAAAGMSEKELELLISQSVISVSEYDGCEKFNINGKCVASNVIYDLLKKQQMYRFVVDVNLIKRNLWALRCDVIEKTKHLLIGMEMKRPCQYFPEWIASIDIIDGEIIVKNSVGISYNADKVRVYDEKDNLFLITEFSVGLLLHNDS